MTTREDIASVASQLAELTRTVEAMANDLKAMTDRADRQQARADSQQNLVDSQQEARKCSKSALTELRENSPTSVIVCKPRRLHFESQSDRSSRELLSRIQSCRERVLPRAERLVSTAYEMPIRPLDHLERGSHHHASSNDPTPAELRARSRRTCAGGRRERGEVDARTPSQRHPRASRPRSCEPLRCPQLQTAEPCRLDGGSHSSDPPVAEF